MEHLICAEFFEDLKGTEGFPLQLSYILPYRQKENITKGC